MYSSSTPNRSASRTGSVYSYGAYNAPQSTINSGAQGSDFTGYTRTTRSFMTSATGAPSRFNQGKTALQKSIKYFRRLIHVRQMDFEFGSWQMLYLLISPQKVYRNFQYRKQTKDQFARDDPAFLVLLAGLLCVTSCCFGFVLGLSVPDTLKLLTWIVVIDCIGSGLLIATGLWWFSNRYLRTVSTNDVEWAYAFDVHLNSFVPLLIVLHGVQLIFVSLIKQTWFISILVGNTFWLVSLSYYFYITFLGYSALNYLRKTTIFLMPMVPIALIYLFSLLVGWNFTSSLMSFYKARL
jgi:hypothetical protein